MDGLKRVWFWVVLALLLFGCGEASRIEEKDRFQTDAQGIVTDTRTGRQWAPDPGERMTWHQAGEYARTAATGWFLGLAAADPGRTAGSGSRGSGSRPLSWPVAVPGLRNRKTPLRPGNSISGRAGTTGSSPTATPRRWRCGLRSEGPLSNISEVKRNLPIL